jgi:PAS domain S-box-containing protein
LDDPVAIREHALMREREYFDTLCNTGDGVYIVDANQHIVRWNKAAERILKYSELDVLNRDCYQVLSGKTSPDKLFCGQNCKVHSGVLNGSPQQNFDILTKTNEGEPLWLNISIVSPANGEDPFVAHIIRDITREKRMELALDKFLASLDTQSTASKETFAEKPMTRHLAAPRGAADRPSATLSGREIEVLTLLAEGLSTKNLAQKLSISHFTARNHIQNILVKLDLHSKAQAVSYAFKKGIL